VVARVTLEIAVGQEFDYLIPAELLNQVFVGSRVKVPFGRREVMGCVTGLSETSTHRNLRSLSGVVGKQSLVTSKVLALTRWIAGYYCCPPEIALKSVLPEVVRREKEGWREQLFVRVVPGAGALPKLTSRQREVWNILEEEREILLQSLLAKAGTTAETVRRLENRGLVSIGPARVERDPYAHEEILPSSPLQLNAEQASALEQIRTALDSPKQGAEKAVFLLHGVTGSGKTEVYLQAIAHALDQGRGAIVLVPEISLTPQTVERFKARFSTGPKATLVAVLHSHLSAGERHDEWHKIRQGRARIAIGARSALFAPVDPLGLIIVDEEHEPSYKQEEAPRYHARDVAVVRGAMEGAAVVLGSATPSLESYYNAKHGKYRLLELKARVDHQRLPVVRIIDMRAESRKQKGPPVFSQLLHEAILQRLERREQVMLFLNRRGFSTSLQCPKCGYVAGCPNCSVTLTYHRKRQVIACHICGFQAPAPAECPESGCRNPAIRYSGLGTEKVEDALARTYPKARVRRMDSDVLQRKEDYRTILGDFRTGKIDILVGTQMIAKGLHFPNVTLVGIIHADLSLHQPDFRAGERTFQLLTQVAGRAGRGDIEGEVLVQAFTPFHPAIQYARRHDFLSFYEQETEFREQLSYPPSARVALLILKGRNEEKVKFCSEHLRKEIEGRTGAIRDLILAGPSPAPLMRAETFYRYHLMLRTRQMLKLSGILGTLRSEWNPPDDVQWTIDIDPVNLS